MKRRNLTGLFCLLLAMLCMLALAACNTPDDGGDQDPCTHGSMTWIDEVAASCTATGTVGHWHCAECGKNFNADKVEISDLTIPFAHNPGSEWLTENDKHYHACLNGCGTKLDETSCFGDLQHDDTGHWIVCDVCGKNTAKSSHDHTANTVTNLASCTEGGYTTYYCICGHSYIDDETQVADHQYAETWEYNDSYHWHAAICGCEGERSQYERHDYKAVVTQPGCETQGYTTYTCACGDSYVSDYVAATGHAVSEWTETASTLFDASKCEYSVTYSGTCTACNTAQTKTEQVERHSFFERVTQQATCGASGFKGTFCSNESCKYHTNAYKDLPYSDPDAHVWVEDAANSDPENGVTAYKCNERDCHATKKISTGTSAGVSKDELGNVSEVELKDATIGIGEIKDAIGQNDVNISAGVVEGESRDAVINDANLSNEQKELLGDGKIYNFTIMTDGDGEIGNFGDGKATVRIRYDLQPTDDPNHIVVWYIAEGELTAIEAVYSEDANGDGYVTFRTNHFSYYTVTRIEPQLLCEKLNKHDERHLHVVEPTCISDGYTICLRCGKEVEGSRVAALGHTMGETVVTEATCATYGVTRHSCADCGLTYEAVTPALGHYYVVSEQVGATCKQAGHVTYSCVHCSDSYTQSLRKLAHVYHSTVVDPTCTEGGYTEKTCTQCGEVSTSRHTPAVGHTEGGVWYKNETEHYHICTTCGEKMSAAAHVPGPAATEQTAQICTVCEYTLAAPIVHIHSPSRVAAVEATCTAGGNIEYYTCTCGAWFMDANATMPIADHTAVIVDAKGHTPTATLYVEPTCENVGYTAGVWCDACKTYLRGHIEISAYGHDYMERTTAPTCTQKGSVTYVCAHCGDEDEARAHEIPALGHNTVSVITAPTCTEGGYTTHTCLRCKEQTIDTDTEALGHKYATAYQSDENGHWHVCTRCDETTESVAHTPDYTEATTAHGIKCVQCSYVIADAIAHTHATAQSVAATNPTCTASGNIAYYVCACGEWFYDAACTQPIYDRASVLLKPVGHTLTYHADQKATCTAVGYTSGAYCSGCDTWLTGHEEIPMLNHVWSKVYQNNENEHWHKCEICDATTTAELHRYDSKVTAPTCKNGGYTTYTCTACGYSYVADETPAVDHVFENGKCKWCGMAEPVKPVDPTNPTVLYRWEQDMGNGEKLVYLFYSNGELIATYQGESDKAYWTEKDGMVFLYQDAEHTQYLGKATINPDGTVTPYVCKEHNYVLVKDQKPTCTEPGETWYECTECGNGYGSGTGPLGHNFVDGKCERCGEPDNGDTPEKPDDPNYPGGDFEGKVVYTYEHIFEDSGRKLLYRFYSNGEVRVEYDGMTMILYWVEEKGTIAVYMTPDLGDFEERFIINKDGNLEPYKCEGEHALELVSSREPNCYEDGYTTYICRLCGHQVSEYTPSVDHEYVDGYCRWCGESEYKDPSETVCYTYVYHVMDENGMFVSKFELTFYMDGKVVVFDNGIMWVYYWVDNNGVITVYEDEAMSLMFGCFQADKNGNLSVYTCPGEHSYQMMESLDPTCMNGGYEVYVCSVCGHSERQELDPVDHVFKDGMCIWCGESNLPPDDTPAIPDGMTYTYKYIDRYVMNDGTVCHDIYFFLDDGTVDARIYENGELVEQVVCYWEHDGRLVRMYFDEDYTDLIDGYTIDSDGTTLILWKCEEHNYKLIESTEPTCTEGGKTTRMCMDCGIRSNSYTDPLGHEYNADGICGRCGESGGEEPVDPSIRYVFETDVTDGEGNVMGKMIYTFYGDGTVTGKFDDVHIKLYWAEQDGIVTMYQDINHTVVGGKLVVGEDGKLSIYDCHGKHVYETVMDQAPTCTDPGYKFMICQWCGEQNEEIIPALGHEYNADGICGRCGESGGETPADPDFEKYKEDVLARMNREWMIAVPSAAVEEMYRNQYETIREMITSAETVEDVDWFYDNQFMMLLEKIRMENEDPEDPDQPDDPTDATVVYTYEMITAEGLKLLYNFYSNGEVRIETHVATMVFYWTEADGFVLIYEDRDHTSLVGKATVNEDNTVTPWTCPDEKHQYQMVIQRDPTCTEGGYEEFRCTECGDSYGTHTDPRGHNIVDGTCQWCGMSEGGDSSELESFRKDILAQMKKDWTEAIPNAEIEAKYQPQYKELCQMVSQSGTIDEIQNIYNGPFQEMIAQVRKSAGEDVWIAEIKVPFAMPEIEAGANVEGFLEANLINRVIYVYYNDGSTTRVLITRDMINTMGQDFSKAGTVTFYVCYKGFETAVEINVLHNNCVHEKTYIDRMESTCTMAGYERIVCAECGEQVSYKIIEMLEHNYVDGTCQWCGIGSDDTLEQTRKEVYAAMKADWKKLSASDIAITEAQQLRFDELLENIQSATSVRMINQIYQKDFKELLALVYSGVDPEQPGDGCNHSYVNGKCEWCGQPEIEVKPIDPPTIVTVIGMEPQFERQFNVMIGEDVEAFIRKNLVGQTVVVRYSDGTQMTISVTRDMINTDGQSFDKFGSVRFDFSCEQDNFIYSATIRINVIADITSEKLVAIYTVSEVDAGDLTLELYESGLCRAIAGESDIMMGEYEFDKNGVLYVTINETTILFSINEDGTATLYQPTGDVIASYNYQGATITVYGKYTGTGEYIATLSVNGMMMTTSTVTLDLEKMTLSSGVIGGTLHIDEKGNLYCKHNFVVIDEREATCTEPGYRNTQCTNCGTGQGGQTAALGHAYGEDGCCVRCGEGYGEIEQPENGIEETRKYILEMMSDDWSWLTQEYDVWSEYHNSYKMLHQSIRMAKTEEELWSLYDNDFMKLREEIEANCERCEQGGDDEFDSAVINVDILFETNHTVTVGSDVEKFLEEYVIGKNILLYLADGTTKTLTVTRDMIDTFGASFDKIGSFVEIEVIYPVDGEDRSVYVYVSVQADFENAQFMGEYVFKQGENKLWFELYDNGYAKVTVYSGDYSDTTSMKYELKDGGLLYVEMNGVKMVLAIHETGVAEMYQPKDDKIDTYTYAGVTIEVYGEYKKAGEYVAVVYDEYQTMTVIITLDLENGKISVPVFSDGELTIGEKNELYCDHRFEVIHKQEATCDKSGYYYEECMLCGASNGMETPALGHNYDASGICMNCGRYSGDGKDDVIIEFPEIPNLNDPENGGSNNDYVVIAPTYSENGTLGDKTFEYVA